ncbi:MAG TPA: acyl-CoA carboxylase subunit beta [Candidatus Latescibacteria bacterium]|nr:acyl-CoA carboxylase subunit beta [Candidatus Latescibacterota bacterium]
MGMEKELKKLDELEREARSGGGPKRIEKQHAAGKLTARERLDLLLDKGSFVELGMFAQHQCYDFGMEKRRPWGDGVITGYGKIDGRLVYVYAQDFTVMGGSVGRVHGQKVAEAHRMAREAGVPIIGLIDSAGGRIQEGGGYSQIFYENVITSGVVPQISAVMGNCSGGGVYSPALTDFIIMIEKVSQMFIAGPAVVKAATGADLTPQELGGTHIHSRISGVCDLVASDDKSCIQLIKDLLSYLPSNYREMAERKECNDPPDRVEESLCELVPVDAKRSYDMRKVIQAIVDRGDFLEIKPDWAKNIITGFARLNGYSVGIIANQPKFLAGVIDCDASDKAARFINICNAFNIPLINLVDVPGYLPGLKEEKKGIIRHGAKMLYAYGRATVPKITCYIRKSYGGATPAMCSKPMGTDVAMGWPTTEIAVMGAEGAVNVLYRKELAEAEDREKVFEEKVKEYRENFNTPYYAASRRMIDMIIRPQETRLNLILTLEMLINKRETKPEKRHGIMPV